jgi:RNA polymerase sigma-70 factor (ECF subfamily)
LLEDVFREQWGRVLAALVGLLGDIELAEEAAQDAFATAAERWPRDGSPDHPTAWLIATARNRAIDRIRRESNLADKTEQLRWALVNAAEETMDETTAFPDERLELIFTCCHPALAQEAQIALTLRLVCGMPTPDIAQAFLVADATMAARLTRAKQKIAAARIPYAVPSADELPLRVDAALTVVHLLYAAGHTA